MELERNSPYWLLVVGASVYLGLALLAPVASARDWPGADLLYAVFAPVCHQIPGRSLACFGRPLAVCHRCLGLYVGFLSGLLVWPWRAALVERLRAALLERPRWILAAVAPMLIDVALARWNTGASRMATGFVAAFPVSLFVWVAACQIHSSLQRTSPQGVDS